MAGGKPVQGASTITQQLVRNLYIQNPEETIERKLIEAHLAYEQEEEHSKEWILTAYLNTAPYGTVEGETAVGAEAAAQTYFGKPAKELNLTESALIAGLPQAPSEYNPFLDPQAAKDRRNEVLEAMEDESYITSDQYQQGAGQRPRPQPRPQVPGDPRPLPLRPRPAGADRQVRDQHGPQRRPQGLHDDRPRAAGTRAGSGRIVRRLLPRRRAGGRAGLGRPRERARSSPSPRPKATRAKASSTTPGRRTASPAPRSRPSSSPTAIKQGIDPDTTYYDGTSPKTLEIPGGGPDWVVNNAEAGRRRRCRSPLPPWHSVNVIFAQLDLDVGPENVTKTAHEMGITSPLESVPAEGIGGLAVGVTPLEMADAYATLANGGIHHDATAIDRVEFPDGKVDEVDPDSGERVLTEGEAYEVTSLLEGVITQGTGAGYTYMGCSAAAGKTGTSEDLSDAWFVGYTPLYSTAVWVGHPQSREATGYGGPDRRSDLALLHGIGRGRQLPRIPAVPPASPSSPASTANTPRPPATRTNTTTAKKIRPTRSRRRKTRAAVRDRTPSRKPPPSRPPKNPLRNRRPNRPRHPLPSRPRSAGASPARADSAVVGTDASFDPEERLDLILRHLGTGRAGLSEREARRRLEQHGPNAIERRQGPSHVRDLALQFTHPLALLLWVAAVLAARRRDSRAGGRDRRRDRPQRRLRLQSRSCRRSERPRRCASSCRRGRGCAVAGRRSRSTPPPSSRATCCCSRRATGSRPTPA